MLKIRLQRIGKKKQAYYKVVVIEHTRKPKGQYVELLGSYDPHSKTLKINSERVKYWLDNGAQSSPTVHNLLINNKIIEGQKVTSWKPKKKKEVETAAETTGTTAEPEEKKDEQIAPEETAEPAPKEKPEEVKEKPEPEKKEKPEEESKPEPEGTDPLEEKDKKE